MSNGRPPALLSVRDIVAGYGTPVLRGLSLTVGAGEVVSVVGPNGCGKSTTLKAILGLVEISSGSVELDGEDVTNLDTHRLVRRQIGYVAQNREVFDTLTVHDNLRVAGQSLAKRLINERIADAFASWPQLFTLRDRRAGVLSGGERRILAIAMALLVRRRLLLLDESTAALAPGLAADFLNQEVRAIARRGTAVLIVEQRVRAALEVSDWAYSMVAGETQFSGPPQTLLANEEFVRSLVG